MRARVIMVSIGAVFLLAGCEQSKPTGPSVQQQRACDMYTDAGGQDPKFTLGDFVTYYNTDRGAFVNMQALLLAALPPNDPRLFKAPEEVAEYAFAQTEKKNTAARQTVSYRLAISLREVYEALKVCAKQELQAKR